MSWFSSAPTIPFVPVSSRPINENVVNPEKTLEGVDAEMLPKVEAKIQELKEHLTSDPAGWTLLLESNGVRGVKKTVSPDKPIAVIRSEIVMPFNVADIFEFFNNNKNAGALDPMINTSEVFKKFSAHSWLGCVTLHGVSYFISLPTFHFTKFHIFFNFYFISNGP